MMVKQIDMKETERFAKVSQGKWHCWQ